MRESMPLVTAWIDHMRAVFGAEAVTGWIRQGMADETFHAKENGHEIGVAATGSLNAVHAGQMVLAAEENVDAGHKRRKR